jgi:hypothetical protein
MSVQQFERPKIMGRCLAPPVLIERSRRSDCSGLRGGPATKRKSFTELARSQRFLNRRGPKAWSLPNKGGGGGWTRAEVYESLTMMKMVVPLDAQSACRTALAVRDQLRPQVAPPAVRRFGQLATVFMTVSGGFTPRTGSVNLAKNNNKRRSSANRTTGKTCYVTVSVAQATAGPEAGSEGWGGCGPGPGSSLLASSS